MILEFEQRYTSGIALEAAGTRRRLTGAAIAFNLPSSVISDPRIGRFREIIRPEAVDRTLNGRVDVKALWNHDANEVIGSRKAGTLVLRKTPAGLLFDIDPPSWADRYLESIGRGDVDGVSFGFRIADEDGESWDARTADGIPLRTVTDMVFREISLTPFPAYDGPTVAVSTRSVQRYRAAAGRVAYDWRTKWQDMQQV